MLAFSKILLFAPDEASEKAGKDLSNPSKWVRKGAKQQAIWDEAQGFGGKPYPHAA
ncbi:MAG: hypothetical protein ABIS01_02910 [Ferruginibacter sp.]